MLKIQVIILFLLASTVSVFAEAELKWETIFYSDTVFQYTTSNQGEPNSSWRNLTFNANGWDSGKGGIGYSDNDDNTIIENTVALFLRRTFKIHHPAEIKRAMLSIDYDDAFVAYINGKEIARSAGLSEGFPGFNEISTVNHEAQMYQGGQPENFVIQENILKELLQQGENVIAIEVHNAGINSSDMSSTAFFFVETFAEENKYLPLPEWFVAPFSFSSSNLPIFIIETEGNQIVNEPKTNVHLGIIYNGPGKRNFITDSLNHYNGTIGIELRGNSTQSFPKKPYTFETRNEDGTNNNVSLLGFPEENDWILRASYYDHTFLRNPLAHYMSRLMGNWSSGTKHCEVVLNGEYQGVYILMEKIKRTKNRLNLSKLKPEDISGEELTGGYIYEVAGQHNDFGHARRLRYPDIDEVAPEQLAYIKKYDDDFRRAMENFNTNNPAELYNQWIDILTFVDYMLIQEASRNPDGYGWSCYFHKDKNGKLRAGPVWDFDQSMYNSTYRDGERYWGWSVDYKQWPDPAFFAQMIEEPYFKYQMKKRWESLRQNEFSNNNLFHYVDSITEHLLEATDRNFKKWPNLGKRIWRELDGFEFFDTYPRQITSLKTYLEKRWNWMDNEMADVSVYTVLEEKRNEAAFVLYPNPASTYLNVNVTLESSAEVSFNIYNLHGQLVQKTNTEFYFTGSRHKKIDLPGTMQPGVYLLQVQIGDDTNLSKRFIKVD